MQQCTIIGGVSAAKVAGAYVGGGTTTTCHIYEATVPTGTTGDIVVTYTNAMLRCHVAAYRLTGGSVSANAETSGIGAVSGQNIKPSSGSHYLAAVAVGSPNDVVSIASPEDYYATLESISFCGSHGAMPGSVGWSYDGSYQWAAVAVGIS